MAEFGKAFAKVIELEGGFVDHPNDPGGATNFGISLRWLKSTGDLDGDGMLDGDIDGDGDVDYQDIRNMSIADAAKLYKEYWWDKYNYGEIPDQHVANKIFDMSVNMGSRQAHKLLQRAINCTLGQPVLKEDGLLGPKTSQAMNIALQQPLAILVGLRAQQEGFYRLLVATKDNYKPFLKGWINRSYS